MEFHSSREERLKQASKEVRDAYERRSIKGFFKKNPRYKIWIMDLVLIVVFVFFIFPAAHKASKRVMLDEYRVESGAFVYNDELFVRLKTLHTGKTVKEKQWTERVFAHVKTVTNEVIGEGEIFFPETKGESFILRFNAPFNEVWEELEITLKSSELKKVFKISIEKEESVLQ